MSTPTANYDIFLYDQTGYDLLEGVGQNRSALAAEQVPIKYANTSLHPVVHDSDTLQLKIDNQLVAGAHIDIAIVYALGY